MSHHKYICTCTLLLTWVAFLHTPAHSQSSCVQMGQEPCISAIRSSQTQISGFATSSSSTVSIQIDGKALSEQPEVQPNGSFSAKASAPLKTGQRITVDETVRYSTKADVPLASDALASCTSAIARAANSPCFSALAAGSPATVTGYVANAQSSVAIQTNNSGQTISKKPDATGRFSFLLATLTASDSVIVTETPPADASLSASAIVASDPSSNSLDLTCAPDCDQAAGHVSLIGGVEQSYLSSEQNQTNGFIQLYTKVNVGYGSRFPGGPWGRVRDLGAPQTNSNQNLISAVSNPSGTITTSSLSTIGYSVDFLVGYELDIRLQPTTQYSFGVIAAYGGTTPLSSTSAVSAYKVPGYQTQECSQLQQRFASPSAYGAGYSSNLIPGNGASPATCLLNVAGGSAAATPVTILAFANQNRTSLFQKWEIGGRTIWRYYANDAKQCDQKDPCGRGMVDYTFGQDASITRGLMRNFVVKIDGVAPIPYSGNYMYLFGSVAIRTVKNVDYPPLILASATPPATPSASTFVEPLMQPNRDFYRIGVGLDVSKIFTKWTSSGTKSK